MANRTYIGNDSVRSRNYLRPSNHDMGQVVTERIDHMVAAQNARHRQALIADGAVLDVWIKNRKGTILCTCQQDTNLATNLDGSPVTTPPDGYEIINLRGDNKPKNPLLGLAGQYQQLKEQEAEDDYRILPSGKDTHLENPVSTTRTSYDSDGRFQSVNLPQNDDDALFEAGERSMFGGEGSRCGICLGTSYEDGWTLFNGVRLLMTARNYTDLSSFTVNAEDHPHTFNSDGGGYVQWTIALPKYWEEILWIRVHDDVYKPKGIAVQGFIGSVWQTLTPELLNTLNGVGGNLQVRAVAVGDQEQTFRLTHIDIVMRLGQTVYGQMENFPFEETSFDERILQASMELEATVTGLEEGSVICESKHRKCWKITSATPLMTNKRQVYNNTVQLLMVQGISQLSVLNRYEETPIDIPYQGNQVRQGF